MSRIQQAREVYKKVNEDRSAFIKEMLDLGYTKPQAMAYYTNCQLGEVGRLLHPILTGRSNGNQP